MLNQITINRRRFHQEVMGIPLIYLTAMNKISFLRNDIVKAGNKEREDRRRLPNELAGKRGLERG